MEHAMHPRHRLFAFIAAICALPVLAADALQVKTGLWETTATSTISGMSIPAEQLAKIPPAQRAQMEQMLKQRTMPRTNTDRSCITQKDLQDGAFRRQATQDGNCTYKQVSATARHQEWAFQCSNDVGGATGTMTVDAPDSTHMRGQLEMKSSNGNASITLAGQWISASCAGADKN